MMNNSGLADIWNVLAEEKAVGLVKRLYPVESSLRIFGTYQHPDNLYGIAFSYNRNIHVPVETFGNLKELLILHLQDTSFEQNDLLLIQLLRSDCIGVFSTLCDDLMRAVSLVSTEKEGVRIILTQLEKWKILFDKGLSGLTLSAQQGLYGELRFLFRLLRKFPNDKVEIVRYWVGCESAMRDFQGTDWAVEVKTTSANNATQLTINGERQLDDTLLDKLFLYHVSVEASHKNGQTLCDIIDALRNQLADDTIALNLFNANLIHAGYFDEQAILYRDRCYRIRQEKAYRVMEHFPRIVEKDLRNGVSNVSYSINISSCDEYTVSDNEVFNRTIRHERD